MTLPKTDIEPPLRVAECRAGEDHAESLDRLIALHTTWLEHCRRPPESEPVAPSALDFLLNAFEEWRDRLGQSLRRAWERELAALTCEQEKLYALHELWREAGQCRPEHCRRLTKVGGRILAVLHDLRDKLPRSPDRTVH